MVERRPEFYTAVYRFVTKIPKGKVVTYGQVAALQRGAVPEVLLVHQLRAAGAGHGPPHGRDHLDGLGPALRHPPEPPPGL